MLDFAVLLCDRLASIIGPSMLPSQGIPAVCAFDRMVVSSSRDRTTIDLPSMETSMASGTVKWFNMTKGYGFIAPDGGGADVFVHITAVQAAGMRELKEGQKLAYEISNQRGKPAAANLRAA
jgi:CspA family cold shock protein